MADDLLAYLRQWDRARYLALLLMPVVKRQDILPLYCFNAELDRIPLVVSEPQIGEIRLQWWLDTLDAMEQGAPQEHPVAAALAQTITAHRLPYGTLRQLAEAHGRLLYADRPESLEELEAHFGYTHSALIQLTALILDPVIAPMAAEAAGLAGVTQGIADIVAEPKRFANLVPKGFELDQLAAHGRKRLAEARARAVPPAVFPAFLPVAAAEKQIEKPNQRLGALSVQWLLWRASRKKRI